MAKRTSAAILNDKLLTDSAKLLRIVNTMCGLAPDVHNQPGGRNQRNFAFAQQFVARFETQATPEQRVALVKLYDMGWNISKLVWNSVENKIAFAVSAPGCAAWVTPDGKVNRAPVGKRTAYLDKNWSDLGGVQ